MTLLTVLLMLIKSRHELIMAHVWQSAVHNNMVSGQSVFLYMQL